jgi:GAF domain-containing protein
MREALTGTGAFLAAARRPDPLPALRDLAGDWLNAEEIELHVPAGTGPLESDDPGLICGPVMIGRRMVGRIEARRSRPFDEDDSALVAALGQIIGGALEYATLQGQLEQYAGQAQANADTLDSLLAFGRSVVSGATTLHALALQVATQTPEMVGGERASVLLLPSDNPEQPVLVLSNGTVSPSYRAREVREHGIAGIVLRERAPLIIDETDTDRRWLGLKLSQNDSRTRCAMAAPLLWGERAIGVLTVTTTLSRLFNTAHLNLLELVACHAALAIHGANLEARLTRLTAQIDCLAAELDVALRAAEAGDLGALAAARAAAARLRAARDGDALTREA